MSWNPSLVEDQTGRTVVITGANSGVGLEAAKVLAAAGAHVVLACRRPDVAAEAARRLDGRVSVGELDLADLDSVAEFVSGFTSEHPSLDLLINNAGVMGGRFGVTAQGHERQMGTNHVGHVALTAGLWPLLQAASDARVVTLSSIAARGGDLTAAMTREDLVDPHAYVPQQHYSRTKQANLLFAVELDRRARAAGSTVRSIAAHPGVSATNLFARQQHDNGRPKFASVVKVVSPVFMQSARRGAEPTLRAATDRTVLGGAFVGPKRLGQIRGPAELLTVYPQGSDPETAAVLWTLTEEILGAPFTP